MTENYPCTIAEHARAEQDIYRIAFSHGRREGYLAGHEAGQLEGHLIGYAEGVRAPENVAYRVAAADSYAAGYVDGLADRRARQEVTR